MINMLHRVHSSDKNNYHDPVKNNRTICYVWMEEFKKKKKKWYTKSPHSVNHLTTASMNIDVDLNATEDFIRH